MNANDLKAEMVWLNSSEAKLRGAAAKAYAISEFKKRFPNANMSRFEVQVDFDENRKAAGAVYFRESKDSLANPLLIDRKYWTQAIKDALGMHQDGGFPFQLSLPQSQSQLLNFLKKMHLSIGDVLNKELKIYVTPTEFFTTKFRQIFKNTQIKFTTAKYGNKWLGGPHMSFWPQQLNFALWCATTACEITRDTLFSSDSSLDLSPQLRSFYLFHVYFTVNLVYQRS